MGSHKLKESDANRKNLFEKLKNIDNKPRDPKINSE